MTKGPSMERKARAKRKQRGKGSSKARPRLLMQQRTKWIVGVLLVVLVVGGGVGAWQWMVARATPTSAPAFNLFASTGKRITLADYVGEHEVVLIFYMGSS